MSESRAEHTRLQFGFRKCSPPALRGVVGVQTGDRVMCADRMSEGITAAGKRELPAVGLSAVGPLAGGPLRPSHGPGGRHPPCSVSGRGACHRREFGFRSEFSPNPHNAPQAGDARTVPGVWGRAGLRPAPCPGWHRACPVTHSLLWWHLEVSRRRALVGVVGPVTLRQGFVRFLTGVPTPVALADGLPSGRAVLWEEQVLGRGWF